MGLIGVINASPLIYLAKLGVLKLIPQLFSEIWTSEEVKTEVLTKESVPEIPVLEEAFSSWLKIYNLSDRTLLNKLEELNIHLGESSVIAIAYELQKSKKEPIAIIDDLMAREIARTLEIQVIGTVGILLRSTRDTFITVKECQTILARLVEETDFRIETKLYSILLKQLEDLR